MRLLTQWGEQHILKKHHHVQSYRSKIKGQCRQECELKHPMDGHTAGI